MPQYELSQKYVLPGHGRACAAGEIVELSDSEARRLLTYEPGLLKPVRQTTQAEVAAARSDEASEDAGPVRRTRRKK